MRQRRRSRSLLTLWLMCVEKHSGFTNARSWLADVREHADPHLTCILVGNKVDLCEGDSNGKRREVPTEEAELWAKEEGLLFVEASAKSGQNVEDAFVQAASDILSKIRRGVFDDDRVSERCLFVTDQYFYPIDIRFGVLFQLRC